MINPFTIGTVTEVYDKESDVMVAYKQEDIDVKLVTIHPLKEGQKEQRLKTGRWRKI